MTRVAFLGLGRMGAAMAARVAGAGDGFALTVWNRTPRADDVPDGAAVADTPADAARDADVVITMVADGPALDAVLDGEDGVLAGANSGSAAGAVVVDMSTIGPRAARAAAERCAAAGLAFLDAPVSGSIALARSGGLVAMVGGDAAVLERVRPVLAAMTREQLHLGDAGAGAAMKLALNAALAVTNQTIAEALALAERAGVTREAAYDVLGAGALASPYVGYKREAFLDPAGTPVAFSIDLMAKDVALALGLAGDLGVALPAVAAARDRLDHARDAGLGERDLAAVLETYGGR